MPRRRGVDLAVVEGWRLDLVCGPFTKQAKRLDADELRETLRGAWELLRDELLGDARPGRRPWAWWSFEALEERPSLPAEELERLRELGELGDVEFDRARREQQTVTAVSFAQGET